MDKKNCLITGATAGIGKEAAAMIAKENYRVVFTARNAQKAEATKDYIIKYSNNIDVDYLICDLSSLKSVNNFCAGFREKYDRIDVLINNAGTWDFKPEFTEEGFEKTFAVNHLAHFYLTNLLLDLIIKGSPSRIVNVSSNAHNYARFSFDDPDSSKDFNFIKVYANSKLANIWFSNVLAVKLREKNVTVNSLMLGVIVSDLLRSFPFPLKQIGRLVSKPTIYGAKPIVRLAVSDDVKEVTGAYFDEFKIGNLSKDAMNYDKAMKFWDLSEKMISSKIENFKSFQIY